MSKSIYDKFVSIESDATTAETNREFRVSRILLISNDGLEDVVFNFAGDTTTGVGKFTLKPKESLSDLEIPANVLYYRATSGTQAFRAWGVLSN
jgi:hypothetical protein